jgi:hypothetical protein
MGGLLLMGLSVLDNYGAVYWFTGAMNYFWLTPFFLAALYAPLYIFVNQKLPSKIWLIVSLIATLLTAISHEQFAMALLVLLAGLGIYQLVKNRRNVKNLIWSGAFLLVALAGFSLYFLAAGNGVRLEQEVATWLPEMYNVPLAVRLESNVRWFFDALINQTGYLLPVIWLSLATLLLRQSKQLPNIITAVTLIAFSILALFADKFMVITVFLREFYPVWGFVGNSKDWLPILIYALVLITTLVAMYLAAAGDKIKAIAPITLSVIAAATIGAVCLSPTVYVSNFRTLYVASVLLVVVIIILLNRLLSNSKSLRSDRH